LPGDPLVFAAMLLNFTKMNGAGNDFVVIDNRERKISLSAAQVAKLAHRHRGVGADGVMLLVPSKSGKTDWAWDFYNADGSEAEMCGNGSRVFARFVQKLTGVTRPITFDTLAGIIHASYHGDRVTVGLTAPHGWRLNEQVALKHGVATIHSVNTGVPHAVLYVKDADETMVGPIGSEIRYHNHFAPKGTNANFVQLLGPNHIRVRTYERGVENETLACGTGVTACALISARVHNFTSPVKIEVQGGDTLEVGFTRKGDEFSEVKLTGPAEFVFEGKIDI
jgi:diaminopimelate epimerase